MYIFSRENVLRVMLKNEVRFKKAYMQLEEITLS